MTHLDSAWWHDIHVAPRAAVTGTLHTDVCVVGLGGSGMAAVREAQALGARVVGVDAGRIAGAAAGRNGGLLLAGLAWFHHDAAEAWGTEAATRLYQFTLEELSRMRDESPEHTWWHGSLRLAHDDAEREDCARQHARMVPDGLPVSWYTGPEGDGLYFPQDGASHPVHRVLALAQRAEADGAQLFESSEVAEISGSALRLASGARVHARTIVVCADGALGTLCPEAAPALRQVRLQMLGTEPALDVRVPRSVYTRDGYDYWQQLPDGRIMLGGGRDRALDDEYTASDAPTALIQQWLEQQLRERVGTQAAITHRWASTVTYTESGLPVARAFGDGVWGAGGYSGTGNVVGRLCGRGLVRRALGHDDAFLDVLDDVAARVATSVATGGASATAADAAHRVTDSAHTAHTAPDTAPAR